MTNQITLFKKPPKVGTNLIMYWLCGPAPSLIKQIKGKLQTSASTRCGWEVWDVDSQGVITVGHWSRRERVYTYENAEEFWDWTIRSHEKYGTKYMKFRPDGKGFNDPRILLPPYFISNYANLLREIDIYPERYPNYDANV